MIVELLKKRSSLALGKSVWLGLCLLHCSVAAYAQSPQSSGLQDERSGASPSSGIQAPARAPQSDRQLAGSISGKIIDQSGASIGGAHVKLAREDQSPAQEILADSNGQFSFSNVAPGPFHLTISSEGLASQEISGTVQPGEPCVIPLAMLVVATQVTEVRVGLTREELADVQIREEEKQRVFGIIPNFFVTYDHNAVPLTAKQKFRLARKSSTDPVTFLGVGAIAGINQAGNRWSGYGQGMQGYAKRYGATYGDVFSGTYIGGAILPSLLKQDPRYIYKGTGSKRMRLLYAVSSSFICRGDNGRWQPNYSNVGGNLAAGAIANIYYPASNRHGASLVFTTALIRLSETTIASIFQEFFVPRLTPNRPTRSTSQP
jgi:Carboxypeptidase regulatory-like domain